MTKDSITRSILKNPIISGARSTNEAVAQRSASSSMTSQPTVGRWSIIRSFYLGCARLLRLLRLLRLWGVFWLVLTVFTGQAWAAELTVPATSRTGHFTVSWPGMTTRHGGSVYIEEQDPQTQEWREIYTGELHIAKTLSLSKPNGTYAYRHRECVVWVIGNGPNTSGGANCTEFAAQTVVVSIPQGGLAPSLVQVASGSLTCAEDTVEVSWTIVADAVYALEVIDRPLGGDWPASWRRITSDFDGLAYPVSGLAPGREFKFRASARVLNDSTVYSLWQESAVVSKAACTTVASPTPFEAEASTLVHADEIEATDSVGVSGGAFKVNEAGAATYTLDIQTVAGTAGVTPHLSLGYSSQGGNGLLGKGWSLNGLSSISRCRQTLLQDRRALPISWGESDRFCLNGQRLLVVSGTYGAPGSVYRTELDSQVRVTAQGGSPGQPDYFTLSAKDGSTTWLGGEGVDPAEVVGYSTAGLAQLDHVLVWQISRFEDSVGNPIVYHYDPDPPDHPLMRVDYGFGASATAAASLEFDYEARPDPQTHYVGGLRLQARTRLAQVRSLQASTLIRRYRLEYRALPTSMAGQRLSLLETLQECGAEACLPPLTFTWAALQSGPSGTVAQPSAGSSVLRHTLGDLDGDGMQDIIWVEKNSDRRRVYYQLLGTREKIELTDVHSDNVRLAVLDYNLDGRGDLAVWDAGGGSNKWRYYLSTPQLLGGQVAWRLGPSRVLPFDHPNATFMDLNSDGITDAYFLTEDSRALKIHMGRRRAAVAPSDP